MTERLLLEANRCGDLVSAILGRARVVLFGESFRVVASRQAIAAPSS
jgi:hypothetical protein